MTGKTYFLLSHLTPYPDKEQESQVVAEQLVQALPTPEADEPSELRENSESTRSALPPQRGQEASSPAWLIALSTSNLSPHFEQEYSYIGTIPPPPLF
jgi:hypothetical protein